MMEANALLINDIRARLLNGLLEYLGLENTYAAIITGSTSQKTDSPKSDLDLRLIVRDFEETCDSFKRFLTDKKLILFEDRNPFAEVKFFLENVPFHVLFYSFSHVEKSLKNRNLGFISTITKGQFVYKQEDVINPVIAECTRIVDEIRNSNEYLVGAKSQFVKAMSRYEQKKYSEAMYCLRVSTTYLIKDYLIKNGFIDIKEQWVLRDIEKADTTAGRTYLQSFVKVHQLEDIQVEQLKKNIAIVSTLINTSNNSTKN